jgi:hypothetical protein
LAWLVTSVASSAEDAPYAVVRPYSTCELDASSVTQAIVAPALVMAPDVRAEITGGVVSVKDLLTSLDTPLSFPAVLYAVTAK